MLFAISKRLCLGKNLTGDSTCPSTRDRDRNTRSTRLYTVLTLLRKLTRALVALVARLFAYIRSSRRKRIGLGPFDDEDSYMGDDFTLLRVLVPS